MVTVTSLPGGPCLEWAEDKGALAPELSPAVRACLSLLSRTQMFPPQKGTRASLCHSVSRPSLPLHPEHRDQSGSGRQCLGSSTGKIFNLQCSQLQGLNAKNAKGASAQVMDAQGNSCGS